VAGLSGAEVIALAAVIVSGIVGLATVAFNLWNSSSERTQQTKERKVDNEEWYRRTLFDRRTQALSQEYAWLIKMNRLRAFVIADRIVASDLTLNAQAAREWYDLNALYLYDTPPGNSEFLGTVDAAEDLTDPAFPSQLNAALDDHRERAAHVMKAWRQ
jgi:hypothetical protein